MNQMRFVSLTLTLLAVAACGSTTPNRADKVSMDLEVKAARQDFETKDPGLARWFSSCAGYALFPSVGKGGYIVGGAYGRGYVYDKQGHIGYTKVTEANIGLQIGGQSYRQVIFFQSEAALQRFTGGNFELSAQASAVLVEAGASADADYRDGVAVFTLPRGGAMAAATVGGQKFDYEAKAFASHHSGAK